MIIQNDLILLAFSERGKQRGGYRGRGCNWTLFCIKEFNSSELFQNSL